MAIHEPIYVDSDFTSSFSAEVFAASVTLDNVAYCKIIFWSELITPEILRNNPDIINNSILLEKTELGRYYKENLTTNVTINNILLFDEEGTLLATRYLQNPVDLSNVKSFKVLLTCYSKTDSTIEADYQINYDEHIQRAYENGISTEHPDLLNAENDIATRDYIAPKHEALVRDNRTIIENVENFEDDNTNIQIKDETPAIYAGKGNKYSYFLWYYWNKEAIEAKVKEKVIDFEITHRPFLGFNDKLGSYLYYYDFREDYIIIIFAGSNSNNKIDIFICENTLNLSVSDYEDLMGNKKEYRLKINRFFDRVYFTIDNTVYTIFSENSDYTPFTIREAVDAGYLNYTIRMYLPINLTLDTLLDGENVYMPDFNDIGDIFIQYSNGKIKFFNIFGDESETLLNPELLNTYTIDDRQNAKLLINMYNTTAQHIKFMVDNHYPIVYLGSEYSVYYDKDYGKYVILFKVPRFTQRTRKTLENFDSFVGSYLLFKDSHVESIYGKELTNNENLFGSSFNSESKPLIAADRGVIVVQSDNYKGCFRNT